MILSDDRIVKASFRECPIDDRKRFKESHCLLPISVGQKIHEGKKFLATLDLINASFKRCTLLVDDTVQWHTLKISRPEISNNNLYQQALLEGDFWLMRNGESIKKLKIPYEILRWERWRMHPDFEKQLKKVESLYETSVSYKISVDENIKDYLERYISRSSHEKVNYDHAFLSCLDYLKEECAVMTLWVEGLYDFEVYPSGRNKAMAATYKYLIQPYHPNLVKPVALRFKKYPLPQFLD